MPVRRQKLSIATPAPSRSSGSIRGMGETIAAEEFSGAMSMGIPLSLPEARGSRPALELRYLSSAGNGPFGFGFGLAAGSVSRSTKRSAPRYQLDDVFVHSGYGELVYLAGQDRTAEQAGRPYTVRSYRPRREGEYPDLQWWIGGIDSFWQVVDRANMTSLLGTDSSARVADPADAGRVFEWLLTETFDARGNHVRYQYLAEDCAGLPAGGLGGNPPSTAARYLSRVSWGNAAPHAGSLVVNLAQTELAALRWHFEVLLDYGQYDEDANPVDQPVGTWSVRADPFSTYAAGFEIASYRLCRSILTVHNFPDELGPQPVLTASTRLRYDSTPYGSLLARIEKVGFRTDPGGRRRSRALAPVELRWSSFDPAAGSWLELDFGPAARPAVSPEDDLRWVGLDGIGVAGLLHAADDGIRFWAPDTIDLAGGLVRYAAPRLVNAAPSAAASAAGVFTLADAIGSGRPQWLDTRPGSAGYAELRRDGSSGPLQPFDSFPSDYASPAAAQVNVTGTGLADLVLIDSTGVGWNASLGAAGYGPRQLVPGGGLPPAAPDQPGEARRFADMLGSGQQHWVRIRNGSVTCWPNLGSGRFGAPVELANAPFLEPDFDPGRLYLLDLDGSGAADLGYRYPGTVRIWRNQSGAGFGAPFDIPMPPDTDASARVDFADVLGSGTSCLVVSQPYPTVRHWVYVFGDGGKPNLLTGVDNGTGQLTSIGYTTSAQQQLVEPGPIADPLPVVPFPVHVTARVQLEDLLSGSTNVQSFRYRHGYYDPDERTFAGFGLVERLDAETTGDGKEPPPLLSRTWYHTGAAPAAGSLEELYRAEYTACDPGSYPMPGSSLVVSAGGEATRQALVSLAGKVLHTELYGLDSTAGLPYRVEDYRYQAVQLAPDADAGPVSFTTRPLESISYDYERNPADPRVEHTLVLAVDDYGNVTEQCQLGYPRRSGQGALPEQCALLAYRSRHGYLNVTEPFRLLGVPAEQVEEQLAGLTLPSAGYLTLAEVENQLAGSGITATATQWSRYDYLPDPGGAPLAAQGLLTRISYAEHEAAVLEQAYAGALDAGALAGLLADQSATGCGLRAGDGAGWWWNAGDQLGYAGADGFYRPRTSMDPFGNTVTGTDDPYCLFVASVTDCLGNSTLATPDYQALDYCRITDPNGSVAETGFDPLGIAQVTSRHGSEGGTAVGFAPLTGWQIPAEQPAVADLVAAPGDYLQQAATAFGYDPLAWTGAVQVSAFDGLGADSAALWAELDQRGYLTREGAVCQRFRDDHRRGRVLLSAPFSAPAGAVAAVLAAVPGGAPVGGVLLSAVEYPGEGQKAPLAQLTYYDGSQRVLQTKLSTGSSDPGQAWQASGTVRYDAKGQLSRQFEPYYSTTAAYDPAEAAQKLGVSSLLHYDALGRLRRTDTPLATFRATVYGPDRNAAGSPWTVSAYDENDTLPQSEYYASLMSAVAPDPREKQVVEQAALCADSPTRSWLDPAGRVVRTVVQDAAVVTADQLRPLGGDPEQLLAALVAAGYLDDRFRFTVAFRSQQPEWTVTLPPPFDSQAAAITALLAQLQRQGTLVPSYVELDAMGNPTRISDARLGAAGLPNFQSVWSLAGDDVHTVSADAGPHWRLRNAAGNVVWERDAMGTVTVSSFDPLQRCTGQRIVHADGSSYTSLVAVFGDSRQPGGSGGQSYFGDPAEWNLRGQLVVALDAAGLSVAPFRSIQGLAYAQFRTLRTDPATVPDWSRPPAADLTGLCTALAALTSPDQLPSLTLPAGLQAVLEPAGYLEQAGYDAAGRLVRAVDADGNVLACSLDDRGLVTGVRLTPAERGSAAVEIGRVGYDAHDRPVSLTVPGVLHSNYVYSPLTFRLTGIRTLSLAGAVSLAGAGSPAGAAATEPVLQDLAYYRDPVGNVGVVVNAASVGVAAPTEPATFGYDPLYRLVSATGRESGDSGPVPYLQQYQHDAGGNLVAISHRGATRWQRALPVAADSNRLAGEAGYDLNGNVISCIEASSIGWTDHHQIATLTTPAGQDGSVSREYAVYAADGRRLRRVCQALPSAGAGQPSATEEVRNLGLLEIVRRTDAEGTRTEWHSTAISAGPLRLGRWLRWAADGAGQPPVPGMRYPLQDVVGSVSCELDASGAPVTYREYLPFGGEALSWAATPLDAQLQLERYSAKELDSAGLYYYGARHYSPLLMRWLSPDPAGTADSLNLFQFVGGNPVTFADQGGRMKIHHWNIKDKTTATIADPAFVNELSSLLGAARMRDNYGTVVFLTEIMASVGEAAFQGLVTALNRKTGAGWRGVAFYAGTSEGGHRHEKTGILTYNVHVENYWQLVQHSPYSRAYVMERQVPGNGFSRRHRYNSRYPVGLRVRTYLGGAQASLDIGGYHNQGPTSGAADRAGQVISAAIQHDVNVLIGDFNTEPPRKRQNTGIETRRSSMREGLTESTSSTSRGGSLYDRAVITNDDVNGRKLKATNQTGTRGGSSDHASNSTVLSTRKRKRDD